MKDYERKRNFKVEKRVERQGRRTRSEREENCVLEWKKNDGREKIWRTIFGFWEEEDDGRRGRRI